MLHELWLEYLARGAQQQAQRERAGQGKAKNLDVALRVHAMTIAEIKKGVRVHFHCVAKMCSAPFFPQGCRGASSRLDFPPKRSSIAAISWAPCSSARSSGVMPEVSGT